MKEKFQAPEGAQTAIDLARKIITNHYTDEPEQESIIDAAWRVLGVCKEQTIDRFNDLVEKARMPYTQALELAISEGCAAPAPAEGGAVAWMLRVIDGPIRHIGPKHDFVPDGCEEIPLYAGQPQPKGVAAQIRAEALGEAARQCEEVKAEAERWARGADTGMYDHQAQGAENCAEAIRTFAAATAAQAPAPAPVDGTETYTPYWQGGLSNAELAQWWCLKTKAEPTDRDMSCFALGVEVGCGMRPAPKPEDFGREAPCAAVQHGKEQP